jgi:hypothetical protein
MAVSIHNLVAAINPKLYCDPSVRSEVEKMVKKEGYLKGADKAKPLDVVYMDLIDIQAKSAVSAPGIKAPVEKHTLIYENMNEGAEAIYFWVIDKLSDIGFKKVDKIVDNFISSPGSGHFSEQGQKASRMQDEGGKWLGAANQVVKSILNILYDLKEFETRMELYTQYNAKDKNLQEGALISLKQVWMDTVDIKRGNTSLKSLAFSQQGAFVTLIDSFMSIKDEAHADKVDLNDRVRRLLKQKITEFNIWVKESERELKKRYEVEKTYLKSQINVIQLYARWAKPYLKAAKALEQSASPSAALVTTFNTSLLELTVLAESGYDPADDVNKGELPKLFKTAKTRKYAAVVVVEFKFRSVPERTQQGYGFKGKVEVTFTSYGLSDEELKILRDEIAKDDVMDVMAVIEGATTESLGTLRDDLTKYLGHIPGISKDEKKEKEEKAEEEPNPFKALASFFRTEKKEEKPQPSKPGEIKKDSDTEKILRSQAIIDARKRSYLLYDLYKKSHKMSSLPNHA